MTTIDIITLDRTPFGALDTQGRLLNAVLKEPLPDPRRFGYRGDIALKFQEQFADEKRPPEYSIEQVLAAADVEAGTIPVLAAYLHNFAGCAMPRRCWHPGSTQRDLCVLRQQHRSAEEISRAVRARHCPCPAAR